MKRKILIVDDDRNTVEYFYKVLKLDDYKIYKIYSSPDAKKILLSEKIDLVLTDWLMPEISGLQMINFVRSEIKHQPLIIMITVLSNVKSQNMAFESGADQYLLKPVKPHILRSTVKELFLKSEQKIHNTDKKIDSVSQIIPEFLAIGIATSTGGPKTLMKIFEKTTFPTNCAYFIVQHGPDWMLSSFAGRLNSVCNIRVKTAVNSEKILAGNIYIAPGDKHLEVTKDFKILLNSNPPENYCRPSADPMFRSLADVFGEFSIGIVMTGLGADGALGIAKIKRSGGGILIQDPIDAIAKSMPKKALELTLSKDTFTERDFSERLGSSIFHKVSKLKKVKSLINNSR